MGVIKSNNGRAVNLANKVVGVLAITLAFTGQSVGREWTDNTGRFHREADFVRWEDGNVWLTTANAKEIRVPFARLSTTDQNFIKAEIGKVPKPTADPLLSPWRASVFKLTEYQSDDAADRGIDHAAPPRKYVYHSCGLTAHLVIDKGTINYWIHGQEWMAQLRYLATGPGPYWYYRPSVGDPSTVQWAFAIHPSGCGCCRYAVWRSDGKRWIFHCYSCWRSTK